MTRADGSQLWPFTVIGILDDIPDATGGLYHRQLRLSGSNPGRSAQRGTVCVIFRRAGPRPGRGRENGQGDRGYVRQFRRPVQTDTERPKQKRCAQGSINIPFVTMVVAGAGLFMVLFLTGNGIAQSVRERIPEFAVLKTLGFSDWGVMALVFAEAAIPCLLGAVIGLGLATVFAAGDTQLLPPELLSARALSAGLGAGPGLGLRRAGGVAQRRHSGLASQAAGCGRRAGGEMTC